VFWITVSPKAGSVLKLRTGHELKLVYPQPGAEPERFQDLDFRYFYLQPMDGPAAENTEAALAVLPGAPAVAAEPADAQAAGNSLKLNAEVEN
jgi:hypothetical protein